MFRNLAFWHVCPEWQGTLGGLGWTLESEPQVTGPLTYAQVLIVVCSCLPLWGGCEGCLAESTTSACLTGISLPQRGVLPGWKGATGGGQSDHATAG